jgi:hypothetical protein
MSKENLQAFHWRDGQRDFRPDLRLDCPKKMPTASFVTRGDGSNVRGWLE